MRLSEVDIEIPDLDAQTRFRDIPVGSFFMYIETKMIYKKIYTARFADSYLNAISLSTSDAMVLFTGPEVVRLVDLDVKVTVV